MESISYTGRDNEDIRQSLIDLVPQLTDQWRDFNESDLGMTIVELIAGAQDMQNFYLDNQTFETYIDTAMQDKNIRALLRDMNFRVPLMHSAVGRITVEFMGTLGNAIVFPRYTKFKSSTVPGVVYLSKDRLNAYEGAQRVEIDIIEGELRTIQYTKKELMENLTTSGNVSRRIYLNDSFVADGTVELIQDGMIEAWTEVDDALLKYRGGRYFSVHKDSVGSIYVLMSVNFLDMLSGDDSVLTITYIRTQGTKGVVNAYQLDTIVDVPELMTYISKVYNERATSGAADEPNLQYAKLLAREHAQTMGRYITVADYANGVATEIQDVMYSVVKDWKTTDLVNRPFTVFVWAVDGNGDNLSLDVQKTLVSKFTEKGITAVSVEYQQTEFVYFDVSVVVTLRPVTEAEKFGILGKIDKYIRDTLSPKNINYGGRLSISILTSSIYTLSPYLKSVVVENPTEDVESTEIQLLRLRNVSVRVSEE